ncbi:MAG TPA: hypothetical protein VG872_01690 [Acidimicrobiia bacterium]|nr:hypothetical protein [Acidimicrobiia bacterium]
MTEYHRLALFGDPVEHSRSPEIHRALLSLSELEGEYGVVRADRALLAEAVGELRDGAWSGLNVTMPLKADAAELADRLAPEAARAGSVNTLANRDHEVVGHSTDATAFSMLFEDPRFGGLDEILVLGAGGSAAAALGMLGRSSTVYVSARRDQAVRDLVARMGGEPIPWETAVVGALVINTTPLGMRGEELPDPVLDSALGLIDLPYASEPTPAVARSIEKGTPVADGHEFLVRQAIVSFGIWTGVDVPYESVLAELRKT